MPSSFIVPLVANEVGVFAQTSMVYGLNLIGALLLMYIFHLLQKNQHSYLLNGGLTWLLPTRINCCFALMMEQLKNVDGD